MNLLERLSNLLAGHGFKSDEELAAAKAASESSQQKAQAPQPQGEGNQRQQNISEPKGSDGVQFKAKARPYNHDPATGYNPEIGQAIVDEAESYLGTPYDRSKQPPIKGPSGGGDCSGTTEKIIQDAVDPNFKRGTFGNNTSGAMAVANSPDLMIVEGGLKNARPGDILYWKKNHNGPYHVAVFSGNGEFNGVTYEDMIWTARREGIAYSFLPAKKFRVGDPPKTVFRHKSAAKSK